MQESLLIKLRGLGIEPQAFDAEVCQTGELGGARRSFASPITFTPYAAASPCSARCVFCSEQLQHREGNILASSLRPAPSYFENLRQVLRALRGLSLGLSLSGLECTDEPKWFMQLLDALAEHEQAGFPFAPKVLYSNGAGLARETSGHQLLPHVSRFGLSRIEMSRHHFAERENDAIMRFHPGRPIRAQRCFESTVADVLGVVPVRLVCVTQIGGIATFDAMAAYLRWARSLGVRDVVFRELARVGDLYRDNPTLRAIQSSRVTMETLVDEVWAHIGNGGAVVPKAARYGYYYWGVELEWERDMRVTLESSDYTLMKAQHRSDTVRKLVLHPNGNLCGDWDPDSQLLLAGMS
ncbi:MAG: hypothetical protein A2289_05510 [Deltaproteobacteria bacterium RIFOXYA12_FULL_58_15]|nr:MAG: hypothetical protein A2289_05510 [Deltaproteobacteria bacterium RIFOXYA12_FULL_58_15]